MFSLNKAAARKASGYNISVNDVISFANHFGFTKSSSRGSRHIIWEKNLDEPIRFFNGREEVYTDRLYISYGMGHRGGDTLKPPESKDMFRVAQALGQEAVDYFLKLAGRQSRKKSRNNDSADLIDIPFFSSWALSLEDQIKSDLYHKEVHPEDYFESYLKIILENDPTINPEEARKLIGKLISLIKEEKEYFISKIDISDFLTALSLFGDNSDPKDIAKFVDSSVEDKNFIETVKYLKEKGSISYDEKSLSIIDNALKNVFAYVQGNKLFKLSKWLIQNGLKKESKLLLRLIA